MALFTIETEGQGDHVLWRENKPQKKYWDQLGFEPTLTAKPLGPRQRSGSKAAYSNAGWGTLPISSCLSLSLTVRFTTISGDTFGCMGLWAYCHSAFTCNMHFSIRCLLHNRRQCVGR